LRQGLKLPQKKNHNSKKTNIEDSNIELETETTKGQRNQDLNTQPATTKTKKRTSKIRSGEEKQ